ncbi:MAG: RidA family protein [Pseudolabrys sp.]|nr:RidA family protein [Pseudolabrys sp.]MCW5684424.1 RidA family protein [Pseudolabrys sp.]
MSGRIDARLKELNIDLPTPSTPAANYVPFKRAGSLVFIAGQVPNANGKDQFTGQVGKEISLEDAQKAARLCAVNILAQLKAAVGGDLDKVVSCVRLGGFVNAVPGYGQQPQVINGASDLMVEVFGDAGRHARAAVGCGSLPRNVPVEVDAIFEVA